jgi:hypothetical protein
VVLIHNSTPPHGQLTESTQLKMPIQAWPWGGRSVWFEARSFLSGLTEGPRWLMKPGLELLTGLAAALGPKRVFSPWGGY